jgi:hypothetical protein
VLSLACVDFQIFGAVVPFVSIDVVDYFTGSQRAAKDLLRHYSVLMASVVLAVGFACALV